MFKSGNVDGSNEHPNFLAIVMFAAHPSMVNETTLTPDSWHLYKQTLLHYRRSLVTSQGMN
jgi:hypothetical protein